MKKPNEFYILPETLSIYGIVLFGLVFVKKSVRDLPEPIHRSILRHERIHVRQWVELLFLPFGIWYLTEFALRYFQYRDWNKAYRNISFEREAYTHEHDPVYLKSRRWYAWARYLRTAAASQKK